MKHLTQGIILASTLGISTGAMAGLFDCISYSVGLDYYQAWRKTKENHHLILPTSFPGATLYLAARGQYLGLELGYDTSIKVKKTWTLAPGTTVGNFTAPVTVTGRSTGRFRGVHLDLQSFLPLACNPSVEFFGAIGYASAGLRLGAGANFMATENIGFRLKAGYEYNSVVRVTYETRYANLGLNRRPFTHAGTVSAGVFYKF